MASRPGPVVARKRNGLRLNVHLRRGRRGFRLSCQSPPLYPAGLVRVLVCAVCACTPRGIRKAEEAALECGMG